MSPASVGCGGANHRDYGVAQIGRVQECIAPRPSGAFVGRVGLHYPEGWPEPEIGWALAHRYWGRGYAFEAATAALRVAFATLDWSRAVSLISPPNLRSIRLAERLGARFERRLVVRGHELSLYAVERRY